MKVLVTGARGMLGRALLRNLAGHQLTGTDLPELDLTCAADVRHYVEAERPRAVVHCAAFTAVDACEAQEALAMRVNGEGTANVAAACHAVGARLIAIGTDYVFDGLAPRPYREDDATGPRTAYGRSKLAGEQAVQRHCPDHTILRIAWLYGAGGPSFVHTMFKLGAQDGQSVRVVNDQIGNPTSCRAVAALIADLLREPLPGIVHGSCEGEATWYDFAREIFRLRGYGRQVEPCTTAEFPRPAPRPANSRLEKRALRLAGRPAMPHWREELARFLKEHPVG